LFDMGTPDYHVSYPGTTLLIPVLRLFTPHREKDLFHHILVKNKKQAKIR